MKPREGKYRWLVAVAGILLLSIALGGSAIAGKKKSAGKGWLGVFIHDVDEDTQEAWDLPVDEGVLVDDVVDDSPAEEAGLETGDVIVKFNGKAVSSSAKLTRYIRRTKPDTEIKIEILRDGETKELAVTIGERDRDYSLYFDEDDFAPLILDMPRIRLPKIPRIPSFPRIYGYYGSGSQVWIGLHLSDLNEQLGEYFGVKDGEGVLIEKVLKDSPAEKAGLKAGDVIVQINGEDVEETEDVIDEISDLEEGDLAEITVLRDRDKMSFSVEVEEDGWKDSWSTSRKAKSRYRQGTPRAKSFIWHDDDDELFKVFRHGKSAPTVRFFSPDDDLEDVSSEIREELREALEELREELQEIREELKEALEEWGDG